MVIVWYWGKKELIYTIGLELCSYPDFTIPAVYISFTNLKHAKVHNKCSLVASYPIQVNKLPRFGSCVLEVDFLE